MSCNELHNSIHLIIMEISLSSIFYRNFKEFKKFKRTKTHALGEMNFPNATWFSVASLLQQGGETYPKSLSGMS